MISSTSPIMWICAAVFGAVSAFLAHRQKRNPYLWFAIGFFFGILGVFSIFFSGNTRKKEPTTPREPIYTILGPSDKFWYYVDADHKQQGPVSRDAIFTQWKEGKLNGSTYVWHEELSEWKALKDYISCV